MSNPTIGDRFSNPVNSINLQNIHKKRTEFTSPTMLGVPKHINPIDSKHQDSTILRRSSIPTLPMGERKIVRNINSKSINEMVLEEFKEPTRVIHIGVSSPKKILQKTPVKKNISLIKNIGKFIKTKSNLGRTPSWSSQRLG
jgi:hypothetical protein